MMSYLFPKRSLGFALVASCVKQKPRKLGVSHYKNLDLKPEDAANLMLVKPQTSGSPSDLVKPVCLFKKVMEEPFRLCAPP